MRDHIELKRFFEEYDFLKEDYMDIIEHVGLMFDVRGHAVYGDDLKYMRADAEGLWQCPAEIISLLNTLKSHNIESYLDIGTCRGYTFLLIHYFLKFFNKNCLTETIDPTKWVDPSLLEVHGINFQLKTSMHYKDSTYDLVFIDGNHSYAQSKLDFLNVGIRSKICIFHDINDDFIRAETGDGGVPRLWEELRQQYRHKEIVLHPNNFNVMGIGVLYVA